jgi:(1->4)-alpha-D-glucan 1-alpha-D-glucosylmutase
MAPPLTATYRVQLNAEFTLRDARERVPYLKALGISHLYCSPILAAGVRSTHGYDVSDPTHVSTLIGGEEAFVALATTLHKHDMGIVLDIVPNHMGIGPENPFWTDVLRHGQASRFADWFDVSWRATTRRLEGKVLIPILGDQLEKVLERDEIWVERTPHGAQVRYFDHQLPVDPATLPPGTDDHPLGRVWSEGADGRARLRALLDRQHYELAFWRAAQRDINYRRFFDVNELICLRVEEPAVFDATHRTVLRFVADGLVDGLRVDHIDGLLEPGRYLERLRAAVDARRPPHAGEMRFPIFVEKILATGERLPEQWPVDGTTGYEFMTSLEDVFIDPEGYATLEAQYHHSARDGGFRAVALSSKRRVLRTSLNADIRRIAPMLARVARRARWEVLPIAAYAGAIVEVTAHLPVYRTYIDASQPDASARDRSVLEETFAAVRQTNADAAALAQLERALVGEWSTATSPVARARLTFVLRWQQLTGPAAAKGVEDTALYIHAPLASRNEVGGDPGVPVEGAVARLHALLVERAEHYPRALNATNTHDTKRSADVRARLDALSEHSEEWERTLKRWRHGHGGFRRLVKGRLAPTRTAGNFVYQALVGVWPLRPPAGDAWLDELRERLNAYLLKAMREAKVSTSWTDPDSEYEAAIAHFLEQLLDAESNGEWIAEVHRFVATIAPQAMWNSLGRLVTHLSAPGVPDLYRGDELWFSALVDPDNRRPVDWEERDLALQGVAEATVDSLAKWRDGMDVSSIKVRIVSKLLAFRRESGLMLAEPSYEQLEVRGSQRESVLAFRRSAGEHELVILVPRLTRRLGERPVGNAWGDTRLVLPRGSAARWQSLIDGEPHLAADGVLHLAHVFSILPVAALARSHG